MRKKTTGRFDSREELEAFIRHKYRNTAIDQGDLAKRCRVSSQTVRNILGSKL